ncbi:MAG: MFS transporter [Actinobacteria bacterium]|nr:MFS transporter [Actinomycetota bacterium]
MKSLGPAFNRMWGASLLTNLADGVLIAAAPLLAVTLTKNPVLISLLSALVMLPWLLFAIPIGAIVDRVDRRFLLAGANATRFVIAALIALLIATNSITIYWLFLATFLIGICEVTADTTAQSLIPQILDKSQFEKGNSKLQISETVVQGFVGTPLSGFLYAIAIYIPFIANSLGFLVAAVLAASIPAKFLRDLRMESSEKEKPDFLAEMKFGITYLYNEKALLRLVLTTASIGFCYSMSTSTIVLFILHELNLTPSLFGIALAIQASGAILGGFIAPRLSTTFGRSKVMATCIFISSLITLLQGLAPNIYVFVALATIASFTISNWNILLMATYQSVIPGHLFGRIHGTRRTLVWGLMPFGSLLGGFIAKGGLRLPLLIGGTIATVIALFSLRFLLHVGQSPAKEALVNE